MSIYDHTKKGADFSAPFSCDPAGARPPKQKLWWSGHTFENKHLIIPATRNKMPDGVARNDRPARQGVFMKARAGLHAH